jgi:hypothetical protein
MDYKEQFERHVLHKPYCGTKFIQIDDGRMLNEERITWIKNIQECMHICAKNDGCRNMETITICKDKQPKSYERIMLLFPNNDKDKKGNETGSYPKFANTHSFM